MVCTKCSANMRFTGKDTFSGREIREYQCPVCGHTDDEDTGKALWKIISESNEEDAREAAAKLAAADKKSQWHRFITRFF